MKKTAVLFCAILSLCIGNAEANNSSKAAKIVAQMNEALGASRLASARYLRFDLQIDDGKITSVRSHAWDRQMEEYRIEWNQGDGSRVIALFNIESGNGEVFVNGHPADGKALADLLQTARHYFINDSYWLLAPFRLSDPGVHLEWLKRVKIGDQFEDVLSVAAARGGPDAGNHYWVYINRKTHRVDRWAFPQVNSGAPISLDKAVSWDWEKWKAYGDGVWLSQSRVCLDEQKVISFPLLGIFEHIDNAVFEDHTAALPSQSMPIHVE